MKFIKLEILNLASLDRPGGETVSFEEGALRESTIFSIVGPTGSGKSTILDAICLALYNVAPRYPRKKGDRGHKIEIYGQPEEGETNRLAPTDPRNILTRGKKRGYSKLTFLANDGTLYRAEWHVEKLRLNFSPAKTLLFRLTEKNTVVTEEEAEWKRLPEIIGLDFDQFLRTVLIAQGSFSEFLKAREEERYQLLEKLIGSEELYTSIAEGISKKKNDAVEAYNIVEAGCRAQMNDIIPEDELPGVNDRLGQLERLEKQTKEELQKVGEALAWYETEEKQCKAVGEYKAAFKDAKQRKEAAASKESRLSLHDATLWGVDLYKEIKTAERGIAEVEAFLKAQAVAAGDKEKQIKTEVEENLEKLRKEAKQAAETLEKQKPHIIRARKIKAELETLKKVLSEKKKARTDAEKAKMKAAGAMKENARAIVKAEADLKKFREELTSLILRNKEEDEVLSQKVKNAASNYDEARTRLAELDAVKLQEEKEKADKMNADLKTAIRIQNDLKKRKEQRDSQQNRRRQLAERNAVVAEELKAFSLEKLSDEIDTLSRSYTLMTSENWENHRAGLEEGQPCPLCGSTSHPYHDENAVAPVIDSMKSLLAGKRDDLKRQTEAKQKLIEEQASNEGKIRELDSSLTEVEKEISKLSEEWAVIKACYEAWKLVVAELEVMQVQVEKNAADAAWNLKHYNELAKEVEKLRTEKEKTENRQREMEKSALEARQELEKKVNGANTLLETEKGKTSALETQLKEKEETLSTASKAMAKEEEEISSRMEMLKQEVGEKDPDAFEKELEEAAGKTDNAVKTKEKFINALEGELKEMKGKEEAKKEQKETLVKTSAEKDAELRDWLETFNEGKPHSINEETIAGFFAATDNWEEIRAELKQLAETYTSTETTLRNEIKIHEEHQKSKPEMTVEALLARKEELERLTNAELIDLKARIQRHETATKQLGALYELQKKAEQKKREWEEISAAIGSDGKTLRKIAQCYTLRFLVEHANVEIRRFNSRYELQQVRNSLGIRVIDHDRADDVRDVTSLSGGETFIVSLGLALGLSAISSRNIGFQNLFIDEGFGTLDPDSLATVIDSLAMLQSSQGKKVGVISHTDTMSERITTQIRIIKNGNSGSSHLELHP